MQVRSDGRDRRRRPIRGQLLEAGEPSWTDGDLEEAYEKQSQREREAVARMDGGCRPAVLVLTFEGKEEEQRGSPRPVRVRLTGVQAPGAQVQGPQAHSQQSKNRQTLAHSVRTQEGAGWDLVL